MNFYPYLEKSYHASKNTLIFLIANASLIAASICFLVGWQLWYNSFFIVLYDTLQTTSVSGEVASKLITQAYNIGKSLIVLLPLLLLIWRIGMPYTYAKLNLLEKAKPWWHVIIFDLCKITIVTFLFAISHLAWRNTWWLVALSCICLIIITFSFIRYMQTIYFSSSHQHRFSNILKSWFTHISSIFFLHLLDLFIIILGFCLLGIFMASFLYLPFWLGTTILILLLLVWGRVLLIWKGFWSYSAYALLTHNI